MKFRTEYIPVPPAGNTALDPNLPITLAGSCFAQNITSIMRRALWDARNPLGTLFNPLSIARLISLSVSTPDKRAIRDTLFNVNGRWKSWLADTGCSAGSAETLISMLNQRLDAFRDSLSANPTLIITFGSAWCWFLADNPASVVANCHKQPADRFTHRLVSVAEITDIWCDLITGLQQQYPELRIIFTVSPVRHLNDGLHGNTLSKATLHLAISGLCRRFGCCEYFPAYEIVCDDLRDYRFYADDLLHPSDRAVRYIWEKFCDTYLDATAKRFVAEGTKISAALSHRPLVAPLTPEEEEMESMRLAGLHDSITRFKQQFPGACI